MAVSNLCSFGSALRLMYLITILCFALGQYSVAAGGVLGSGLRQQFACNFLSDVFSFTQKDTCF